jgi:integrase
MDLLYLVCRSNGVYAYRRRITSPQMQVACGTMMFDRSLKTRDPLKAAELWKVKNTEFEAMQAKADGTAVDQHEWKLLLAAAAAHGLARPDASKIGPVDYEMEHGRHMAFIDAYLVEMKKLTPQQLSAPFANKPPKTSGDMLLKAVLEGRERPPVLLREVVGAYLKDHGRQSSYNDLAKQVELVISALEKVMGRANPPIQMIDRGAAYAFRDSLTAKGNAIGTIKRRIGTIKAILNHGEHRFDLPDWRNPFNKIKLPQDDDTAGEVKRDPLTLDDIRNVRDHQSGMNDDARDIWHLMMFTGAGPNEARGLQWGEVHLDDATPHFEVKPNGRRRLKVGERKRRIPLVGTALTMMRRRRESAIEGSSDVFPRYAHHPDANTLSATLGKPMRAAKVWRKSRKVPYSLRHSVKDWLRRGGQRDLQLLIMGHGHGEGRAASGYGGDDLLDKQATYLRGALGAAGVIDYPALEDRKA